MSTGTRYCRVCAAVLCIAAAWACVAGGRPALASQRHAAIPRAAVLVVYLPQVPLYAPEADSAALKPYQKQVDKLPVRDAMLSSVGNAVLPVKWISRSVVGEYDKGPERTQADPDQVARLMRDDRTDSVVLIQLYAQLTDGLKGLMIAATIDVAEKTPQGPIEVKHRDITATVSIANSGAPLSPKERAMIKQDGVRARARIWFANGGERARNATLFDLIEFQKQLRKALASPIEK